MDSTAAGLIGAAIGALAAIISAFVASTLQARQEHHKWLRDRKQEAYANSVKYIVRVCNKRSIITADGLTVVGQDAQKEWFDDMSEALTWMTNLSIYCSSGQRAKIKEALDRIREVMADLMFGQETKTGKEFLSVFLFAYEVILSSQRIDISR